MPIKILGVVGSKRRRGNTSILVETLLEAAETQGAHTEQIFLDDYDFADCNGCEGCQKDFQCVVDDGMQAIYPKILEADGLVIGSPTYFYNITALMKAFLDRLYCYEIFDPEDRSVWIPFNETGKIKYAVALAVCEQATEEDMGFTAQALSKPLEALGYRITDTVKSLNAFRKGEIAKDEKELAKAKKAGIRLVKTLKLREDVIERFK